MSILRHLRHLRHLVHRARPSRVTKSKNQARRRSLIIEHPPLLLLEWDDDFNLTNAPESIKKMGLIPIHEAQHRERVRREKYLANLGKRATTEDAKDEE